MSSTELLASNSLSKSLSWFKSEKPGISLKEGTGDADSEEVAMVEVEIDDAGLFREAERSSETVGEETFGRIFRIGA